MYEEKFKILESVNNIVNYCKSNCNKGECKTCIFYSPLKDYCPFMGELVPYNWAGIDAVYNAR